MIVSFIVIAWLDYKSQFLIQLQFAGWWWLMSGCTEMFTVFFLRCHRLIFRGQVAPIPYKGTTKYAYPRYESIMSSWWFIQVQSTGSRPVMSVMYPKTAPILWQDEIGATYPHTTHPSVNESLASRQQWMVFVKLAVCTLLGGRRRKRGVKSIIMS